MHFLIKEYWYLYLSVNRSECWWVSGGSHKAQTLTPEMKTGFTPVSTSNGTGPAARKSFNLDLV